MAPPISTILFDIGGVLLSNGWEAESRRRVTERFGIDFEDFEQRHERIVADFENGRVSLTDYLDLTVFYQPRQFDHAEFREAIYAESQAFPDSLEFLAHVSGSKKFLLATVNNESRELNIYRIQRFGLTAHFSAFLSSCFLGIRKPDPKIYQTAMEILQKNAEECVIIDDRETNLEAAHKLGMRTVLFRNAEQCAQELQALGILL